MCWVHAERLVHRLDAFTAAHIRTRQRVRARIRWLYADLKACRRDPVPHRKKQSRRRFDRLSSQRNCAPCHPTKGYAIEFRASCGEVLSNA